MKIAVIGTGYVGLVTGTCLAESGNEVTCVDKIAAKVQMLQDGQCPIYEPGLTELVQRNLREGRLRFSTELSGAIGEAELIFIAVGTPQGSDGGANLEGIWAAGCEIAEHLTAPKIIVIKSTVPVGTNAELARRMAEITDVAFDVASNPEFLKEGSAIADFVRPDRVVIGARSQPVIARLRRLYGPFITSDRPFLPMSPESAEMTKYVANCLLATKISFINEMANLCSDYDAVIDDVRRGIGHDQRIGFSFLAPGVGYGGSCFPKDIRALVQMARSVGQSARIMEAVDAVNEAQKQVLGRMILDHFGESAPGRTVAIWGLAFKAETDDIRESPALRLIDDLLAAGVTVRVTDPVAMDNIRSIYGDQLVYCSHRYDALASADALAVVTDWDEYGNPDFHKMSALMHEHVIFDGRNLFDPTLAIENGYSYRGIGRLPSKSQASVDLDRAPSKRGHSPHKTTNSLPVSSTKKASRKLKPRTAVSSCSPGCQVPADRGES